MRHLIEIHGLKLQAFHGVLPQEHSVGNLYTIDCTVETDFTGAMRDDDLTQTVNYAEVVAIIRDEMAQPCQLLEHVGGHIVSRLEARWPQGPGGIRHIDLRIAKHRPPIDADIDHCAVRIIT